MASHNPPPALNTTAAASSDPLPPVSPVSRTGTFPHKTSPAVTTQTPYIETTMAAVNDTPVELDGTPTSLEELKRRDTKESRDGTFSPDLGEEESAAEELGGGAGVGKDLKEKRAALLATRSKDPGVIVDLPSDPTPEEVEAAKVAAGTTTPALGNEEPTSTRAKITDKLKSIVS